MPYNRYDGRGYGDNGMGPWRPCAPCTPWGDDSSQWNDEYLRRQRGWRSPARDVYQNAPQWDDQRASRWEDGQNFRREGRKAVYEGNGRWSPQRDERRSVWPEDRDLAYQSGKKQPQWDKKRLEEPEDENQKTLSIKETPQETADLYMADEPEKAWMEQDWLYMKQLCPNPARKLQKYVDDALDKLEYENSMMFDEYPDKVAVNRLIHDVISAVQENEPALLDESVFMRKDNHSVKRPQMLFSDQSVETVLPDQTWSSCVEAFIQVMVMAEMHHRRWRYYRMQRRSY